MASHLSVAGATRNSRHMNEKTNMWCTQCAEIQGFRQAVTKTDLAASHHNLEKEIPMMGASRRSKSTLRCSLGKKTRRGNTECLLPAVTLVLAFLQSLRDAKVSSGAKAAKNLDIIIQRRQ